VPQGRRRPESLLPLSKEFLEAGKKRLAGDTAHQATSEFWVNNDANPRAFAHPHKILPDQNWRF